MQTWFDKYDYSPAQPLDAAGGSVYRGIDKHTGAIVAVKIQEIHPRWDNGMLQQRLERARQLQHPNLLPCWDFDRWENENSVTYASAMPLITEGALSAVSPTQWTLQQKCDITEGVLNALRYLHQQGLVCQNLAAEHILITKVQDIVVPQLINYSTPSKIPLAFFKNYEYLAPEQFYDAAEFNERTDVWAAGVLLFWLWTNGSMPFGKRSTQLPNAKIKERILSEKPLPSTLSDIPQPIQKIIWNCLRNDSQERWASIDGILAVYQQDKQKLLERKTQPSNASEPQKEDYAVPFWQRKVRRVPSKPINWLLVLLALVAAAVLGWLLN